MNYYGKKIYLQTDRKQKKNLFQKRKTLLDIFNIFITKLKNKNKCFKNTALKFFFIEHQLTWNRTLIKNGEKKFKYI